MVWNLIFTGVTVIIGHIAKNTQDKKRIAREKAQEQLILQQEIENNLKKIKPEDLTLTVSNNSTFQKKELHVVQQSQPKKKKKSFLSRILPIIGGAAIVAGCWCCGIPIEIGLKIGTGGTAIGVSHLFNDNKRKTPMICDDPQKDKKNVPLICDDPQKEEKHIPLIYEPDDSPKIEEIFDEPIKSENVPFEKTYEKMFDKQETNTFDFSSNVQNNIDFDKTFNEVYHKQKGIGYFDVSSKTPGIKFSDDNFSFDFKSNGIKYNSHTHLTSEFGIGNEIGVSTDKIFGGLSVIDNNVRKTCGVGIDVPNSFNQEAFYYCTIVTKTNQPRIATVKVYDTRSDFNLPLLGYMGSVRKELILKGDETQYTERIGISYNGLSNIGGGFLLKQIGKQIGKMTLIETGEILLVGNTVVIP
jgi:hypothetical protein